MYFQLLHGIHVERDTKYEAKPIRNKDGSPGYASQPVVKSEYDLTKAFGANKFKRLTDGQAKALLQAEVDSSSESVSDSEETVADAVKRSAAAIADPSSKEVTEHFDAAKEANVRVFVKNRKYTVTDAEGTALSAEQSLSKAEVSDFITTRVE